MTAPDLTRADAEEAIADVLRALGGLSHLAMAGALHAEPAAELPGRLMLLTQAKASVEALVGLLGDSARRLP